MSKKNESPISVAGLCRVFAVLTLSVTLLACGGGGGSSGSGEAGEGTSADVRSDTLQPEEDEASFEREFAINSANRSFGLPGELISLQVSGVDDSVTVSLAGIAITPQDIDGSSVTFVVPEGALSGPLKLIKGDAISNAIWFYVSQNGVLAPIEDEVRIDRMGNKIAIGHLLVSLRDNRDSRAEAERLAGLVSGEVVGRIRLLNGWQIKVDADSLATLEAMATVLKAEPSVSFTLLDMELRPDAVDWSQDPDRQEQRSRNRVEEGVALYESSVHPTEVGKHRPFFMSIGISEQGVDFQHGDFSGYGANGSSSSGSVAIYSAQQDARDSAHGSNVVGVIAAELGDGANAGLLQALREAHGGANLSAGINSGSWGLGRLARTEQQLEAGAQVVNWSWGIHKEGTLNCSGAVLTSNTVTESSFNQYANALNTFFRNLPASYPNAVIVSSAGNGATNAGRVGNRLPSSIVSDQLLVVGAHTSGGAVGTNISEDEESASLASTACFNVAQAAAAKRAWYSNYGSRVDLSASGTIMGLDNTAYATGNRGTSYAAPLVTATIALMQSINPQLTPIDIKSLLRRSALAIVNQVSSVGSGDVFTRPLSADESAASEGSGARLNVEGAIRGALDSVAGESLPLAEPLTVRLGPSQGEVTQRVTVNIPPNEPLFHKVDIVFLVDVSVSYDDDIDNFRRYADELIDTFATVGTEVSIGLASFSDYPFFPFGDPGDYAFRSNQVLTEQFDQVKAGLNQLRILSGSDEAESQLEALYRVSQENMGWTAGSLPVVFLATDASFHDSDNESSYPGAGYNDSLSALNRRGIRVYGLQSGKLVEDVVRIAEATGGEAFKLSDDSAEVVDAVVSALEDVSANVSVSLEPNGDFAGLVKSITPVGQSGADAGDPINGVNSGDTVAFDVVFGRGYFNDNSNHTFSFRLRVVAEGVAVLQDIPVSVVLQ